MPIYLKNWTEEKRSAYLYQIMATHEATAAKQKLFLRLANSANKQAEIWKKKSSSIGETLPQHYQPDLRTRLVAHLIKHLGSERIRFILSTMKVRGMSVYSNANPEYPLPSAIADLERRHKALSTGGNLRAAVFGINDGLVSNASLLLGVAGANVNQHIILLTGIAGLLAGALSMAAGEYISVRSQRELYEYQISLERDELRLYPEEEAKELAIIYHARGLPEEEATKLAQLTIQNPEQALDTLSREELGLNPKELGSPYGAAVSSFFSFCAGAFLPLIPYLFGSSSWNFMVMIILTALGLFSVGATLSLFTNKSAFQSGLRMLCIGGSAGVFTFLIGKLLSVTLF